MRIDAASARAHGDEEPGADARFPRRAHRVADSGCTTEAGRYTIPRTGKTASVRFVGLDPKPK